MTVARFELTEELLAEARSYAANEPWDLPLVLSQTAGLLRHSARDELVLVTAPSIAPGIEVAVPADWFHVYASGPPRSVRVLVLACVMTMWGAFKFQAEDPMNTTGQVIEMSLDLLAGGAFSDMIHLLRQHMSERGGAEPSTSGDE